MWSTGWKGLSWVDPKTKSGIETISSLPVEPEIVFQVLTCEKWVESRSYLWSKCQQLSTLCLWQLDPLCRGIHRRVNWHKKKWKIELLPSSKLTSQPSESSYPSLANTCLRIFFARGPTKPGKKSSNHAGRANFQRRITKLANLPTCSIMENDPFFWAKDGIREQFLAGNKCLSCVRETSSKNGPRYLGWWIIMSFCHLPSMLFGKQTPTFCLDVLWQRPVAMNEESTILCPNLLFEDASHDKFEHFFTLVIIRWSWTLIVTYQSYHNSHITV